MARSPFQGTFVPNVRPTVVTAPDAIVYLNGEQEVIGCPQCTRTFNLNKYITSIQTDLSVESAPGSASIQLSIPRHTIDDFYFDGNPVVTAMMEVEIYAKGYYLVEGVPQYYPIFWGIVTEVSDNYSAGEHSVSIHCADILKWWELCKMNINPAYTAPAGQQGRDFIKGNVYAQTNPYDIIFTLALQSFGDVLVATGSFNNQVQEANQRATFDAALSDMMLYWSKRFSRMRSNLVLYGTNGNAVRGDTIYQTYLKNGKRNGQSYASSSVRDANGGPDAGQMGYDPASSDVAAFKQVTANAGQIDLWQSEYQTKLELANAAKESIGFEFYMDVTGDIVFKPPFYNLDVLGNKPISWIQDIDVIDWDFSESESEVITQIVMQGSYKGTIDYGTTSQITPFTSVTDYHLLRKYGWRSQNYNSEYMSDPQLMFYHGLDVLDRINSRRHRGSMSIPMRPELRLGFPIYVAPKDQIWYVSGISHSITFGSRAVTSLTLTAKRQKFIAPKGIGKLTLGRYAGSAETSQDGKPSAYRYTSRQLAKNATFNLNVEGAASIPAFEEAYVARAGSDSPYDPLILRHPKTGRIVGYPNIVMAYTRPFTGDASKQAGQKNTASPYIPKADQAKQLNNLETDNEVGLDGLTVSDEDALRDKYLTNRYQYGLNSAGVFIYAHDKSVGGSVISEAVALPSKNLNVLPRNAATQNLVAKTALIRPVSDERGFEVVGHYRYGRSLFLKDGRLITNGATQSRAKIDIPLALSGDMSAMLTAQSQGLTSVTTGYDDPARTLATLTPDDRQTAAIINPESTKAEFVDVGDNFVETATLGSQSQLGSPEVEASQLSRALTLAEMSIKDAQSRNDEDCACLTGRQDLAFINSGYQVKTLTGTAVEDLSTLTSLEAGSSPINSGATQAAVSATNQAQAAFTTAQERFRELEKESAADPTNETKQQAVLDQIPVVERAQAAMFAADEALDTLRGKYQTSSSVFTQTTSELISKVDQFLVNLYSALDTPHQELEKALRGDLLPGQPGDSSNLNAAQTSPPSEFAPPFSAPNRFMLGDSTAIVGAIQSNRAGLTQAWRGFNDNLKANTERASLSRQIGQDQASIARLTATRGRLVQQQNSSAVIIGLDVQAAISEIDSQLTKLQQEVANNQAKLSNV